MPVAAAAGVVHLLLVQMDQLARAATAVLVQHRLFLAGQLLTQAAAAVALGQLRQQPILLVLAVLAAVATQAQAHSLPQTTDQTAPRIQAVVAALVTKASMCLVTIMETAVLAVLALSSLSTTSALPQSSPSSHRRSGLHQRVR